MARTWTPGKGGPTTVDNLRKELTKLAKKKKGQKLIDNKFVKDHLFLGHTKGDIRKIATALANLRTVSMSTLMISSLDATAQKEVLNWIKSVPASKLKFSKGTWTIDTKGSAVAADGTYKFITVDKKALDGMNKDDIVKKSRKWSKISQKKPKVACQFDSDGTPLIYHLDY